MLAASIEFNKIIDYLAEYLGIKSVWDVFRIIIDIAVVAYCVYLLLRFIKDTRAYQLLKGVAIILLIALFAHLLNLTTISYIVTAFLQISPVLLIVMFQPEIRRFIENLGTQTLKEFFSSHKKTETEEVSAMLDEVVAACMLMSEEKIGALIVFERQISLGEIVRTGTIVDAGVSTQMIRLMFEPNTPLHDGAMIIKNNRIHAAACYLPLSDSMSISKDLGTRHRAGIGVTENIDCVSVIVSEETGNISIAVDGKLKRRYTSEILKRDLLGLLVTEETPTKKKKINKLLKRKEKNDE